MRFTDAAQQQIPFYFLSFFSGFSRQCGSKGSWKSASCLYQWKLHMERKYKGVRGEATFFSSLVFQLTGSLMFCLCHFETLASPALHGEYRVHETKPFQPWRSSWATIIWIANRCLTEFLRQPVGGGNEAGAFMKRCKGGIWIMWECANRADISTAFKKWEEKSIKHSITNCDIASIQGHQISGLFGCCRQVPVDYLAAVDEVQWE